VAYICRMSFETSADSYDRFMGRYSEPLAAAFAGLLALRAGQRALDVGCGPGALVAEFVTRVGSASIAAVDPSESFVLATRSRFPGVAVFVASAEDLPFDDDAFDVVAAQLVVHFMTDPVAGLRDMARVTAPGGTVAANVWDFAGDRAPLSVFWRAVAGGDPAAHDESGLPGARAGHLVELFEEAGLRDLRATELVVRSAYESVDDWWEPYTLGVGPAGDYVARLDEDQRAELKRECAGLLADGPFTIDATAWTVVGRA